VEAGNRIQLVNTAIKVAKSLILVVDDDEDILQLTCAMLQQSVHTTVAAKNGREALLCVETMTDSISLIVMDLVMPVMGGKIAADKLALTHPNIKILFVSAYIPYEADLLKRNTLKKPFTNDQLIKTVNDLMA